MPHGNGVGRVRWTFAGLLLAGAVAGLLARADGQDEPREKEGVLVRLDATGNVEVVPADVRQVEQAPPAAGLFVWAAGDEREQWAAVGPGWRPAAPALAGAPAQLADRTRGGAGFADPAAPQLTVQLEQISPDTSTRDAGVFPLTPAAGGRLLNPRPTFRRLPLAREPRFPAATARLTSARLDRPVLIHFAAGQAKVRFEQIKDLPKEMAADGLPPGTYVFGPDQGLDGTFVTFIVDDPGDREALLRPVEALATLLRSRTDPLVVQFAFDHLLSVRGDNSAPLYLSDAYDLLEEAGEGRLTPHLRRQKERLLRCLQAPPDRRGEALLATAPPGEATGVTEIDSARQWIASARWREALAALDQPELTRKAAADRRVLGLAELYRGVVLAEAGLNREAEARAAFERALAALADAPPDLFRARVNYANFLQRIATDQVHNHALQMAAGTPQPFLGALRNWLQARQHYEAALPLAEQLPTPGKRAALRANLARLYSLLADVIRTLDAPAGGARRCAALEKAAARTADALAAAAGADAGAETAVRAQAEEVRALLAYRGGDDAAAIASARRALGLYLEGGQLAGAENAYRVLGLVAERAGPEERVAALHHFQVAQLISEELRERFPPDRAGLTRAGFFARKAYVTEKIVGLLLAEGRPDEALRELELGKARSLQDLLAAQGTRANVPDAGLKKLLASWPAQTAAVEYFLGTDKAYALVVGTDGKVSTHLLRDGKGRPVVPRELIGRVQAFLAGVQHQAGKLYDRLSARRGYDNTWQDELHRFGQELLPPEVRERLQGAKTLVVVPQHILHYFPFAALVTEPDAKQTKAHMARPRFLIDEPYDLVYAPSLSVWHRGPAAAARQVWAVGAAEVAGLPALEGVKKDLENLRGVFGPRVKGVLEGDEARPSAVRKILPQRGLLVFASHGLNLPEQPLESHLLLQPEGAGAAGDGGAGRLTAGDLFARKVHADLVVMSACYSGLGDRSPLPGDELFGLQRAFLHGGARTVVSGLWDVYDGTAPDLMRGFFERLGEGRPAASALADAQRAFLGNLRTTNQDEFFLHPYFWAVYTVAGDERTRFQP